MLIPGGLMFSYSCSLEKKKQKLLAYSKTPRLRTWILRACYAKMSQLSPPLYKNLFSLKFETGSYLLKSMEKILYTLVISVR